MQPLYQYIYSNCRRQFSVSIETFYSACGQLCSCYHENCGSILDSESLAICPKCHESIEANLTQRNIGVIDSDVPLQTQSYPNNNYLQSTVPSPTIKESDQINRSQKSVHWGKKNTVIASLSGSIAFLLLLGFCHRYSRLNTISAPNVP